MHFLTSIHYFIQFPPFIFFSFQVEMKARTLMRIAMTAMKKTATMMRRGSMGLVRVHAVALTPASLSRLRLSCRIGTAKCVTMTEYFTILMIFILYTLLLTKYSTNLIN